MSLAIGDVIYERNRQQWEEKFSTEHDDQHDAGELAAAGAAYALNAADQLHPYTQGDGGNEVPFCWMWDKQWWKPKDPRRDLVRAAALILAEIERMDRASSKPPNVLGNRLAAGGATKKGEIE